MIVIKAPGGWTPDWLAFPIDPTWREGQPYRTRKCWIEGEDLAALLGPKVEDRLLFGENMPRLVPQRVALAIETPCKECDGHGEVLAGDYLGGPYHKPGGPGEFHPVPCEDCAGSGVRLRAEYTAQVDAVVPIVTHHIPGWHVYVWSNGHAYLVWPSEHQRRLPDADWSPGRWAVLTSDVQPFAPGSISEHRYLRPFDGPVANLDEVLA